MSRFCWFGGTGGGCGGQFHEKSVQCNTKDLWPRIEDCPHVVFLHLPFPEKDNLFVSLKFHGIFKIQQTQMSTPFHFASGILMFASGREKDPVACC